MLFLLEEPGIAAVGPLLLYPQGTVQHAGVALGLRGTADHVLRGLPADADGYFGMLACTREVSAVTFACTMLRKADYIAVGGLEELYRTHYQDVDFCLRLLDQGKKILYTPRATLMHYESATRGTSYDAVDRALFLDVWQDTIAKGDPYSRWESEAREHEVAV
jgi:GT2 family glycosyltransferase